MSALDITCRSGAGGGAGAPAEVRRRSRRTRRAGSCRRRTPSVSQRTAIVETRSSTRRASLRGSWPVTCAEPRTGSISGSARRAARRGSAPVVGSSSPLHAAGQQAERTMASAGGASQAGVSGRVGGRVSWARDSLGRVSDASLPQTPRCGCAFAVRVRLALTAHDIPARRPEEAKAIVPQSEGFQSPETSTDFGANEWLVEEMYERYQRDPKSVDAGLGDATSRTTVRRVRTATADTATAPRRPPTPAAKSEPAPRQPKPAPESDAAGAEAAPSKESRPRRPGPAAAKPVAKAAPQSAAAETPSTQPTQPVAKDAQAGRHGRGRATSRRYTVLRGIAAAHGRRTWTPR